MEGVRRKSSLFAFNWPWHNLLVLSEKVPLGY